MRLAAQTKLGFYPAHRDAVEAICEHLRPDEARPDMMTILDPCAGEGIAVRRIAHALDIDAKRIYCVELDAGRAEKCRENMPGARVLGPASFMSTSVTAGSISLAYVNPPFDVELGGGKRQEQTFAETATLALKAGGVLVLVLPYSAIRTNTTFQDFLDDNYDDARLYRFPSGPDANGVERRPFNEIVYIGKKRAEEYDRDGRGYLRRCGLAYNEPSIVVGTDDRTWRVPLAHAPASFRKVELTDDEIIEALERSPLNRLLGAPADPLARRPPCDLGAGHVALMLASGLLNGTLYPPGEPPHIVRGTARKVDYQSSPAESKTDDAGKVISITEVWSQKILLTVRVIDHTGIILTFEDGQGNGAVIVKG